MINAIKNLMGIGAKTDYAALVHQGAIILDVRSTSEFADEHIQSAVNIPVDQLNSRLSKLEDKNKCLICCCASGMRSTMAKKILESNGYTKVHNAGSWRSVQQKL